MTQQTVDRKLLQEIIDSQTALSSAAYRLAMAYQAAAGPSIRLLTDLTIPAEVKPAEAPVEVQKHYNKQGLSDMADAQEKHRPAKRVSSAKRLSEKRASARRSSRPATPKPQTSVPREALKLGAKVFVGGREAKYFRLARGSNGEFAFVDFVDGDKEHAKVRSSDIRLEPTKADPPPASSAEPQETPEALTTPTPAEATVSETEETPPEGGTLESVAAETSANGDFTEDAACQQCGGLGRTASGAFCTCETGRTLQAQLEREARAKQAPPAKPAKAPKAEKKAAPAAAPKKLSPDEIAVTVRRALVTLAPTKDKPATAQSVSDLTGLGPSDSLQGILALKNANLVTLNGQGRVIAVKAEETPATPSLTVKKGGKDVASKAAETLGQIEAERPSE
jgi:hypothetical protein